MESKINLNFSEIKKLSEIFDELFPRGPKQEIVFQKSGGKLYYLDDNSWYSAINLANKGYRGMCVKNLINSALETYPRNTELREFSGNTEVNEKKKNREIYNITKDYFLYICADLTQHTSIYDPELTLIGLIKNYHVNELKALLGELSTLVYTEVNPEYRLGQLNVAVLLNEYKEIRIKNYTLKIKKASLERVLEIIREINNYIV